MARKESIDARAAALLTLMCATWAAGQIATKIGLLGISPNWQAGLRSLGSALLVIMWARHRGVSLFQRDGTLPGGLLCGAVFAAEFACLFIGLEHTTAARGVIFLYMAPFVVAIGAHWLIPDDRMSWPKFAGLSCAFGGLILAVWNGLSHSAASEFFGDALCFAGAICWGATTLIVRGTALSKASAEKTLLYQLAFAAVALPLFGVALGERGVFNPTWPVIATFLFQMVFVTFITFLAWFWMITQYPATKLAAFTFLTPAIGVVFGHVALGEPVTPLMIAALACVAAGIFLVNRPAKSA
ncbi:DMT family transporter [Terrarubrum flagellatum]|uniref:DMT family transporter n=1 Tax=Terrirubrum flagellatum TaxID=2895980 RepID=UPI0031451000